MVSNKRECCAALGWERTRHRPSMPTAVKKTTRPRRKRWRVGQVMTHNAYDGSGVLLLAAGQQIENEAKARRLSAGDVRLLRPGEGLEGRS